MPVLRAVNNPLEISPGHCRSGELASRQPVVGLRFTLRGQLLYFSPWCWLTLIVFALWALVRYRWHELAIFISTLAVMIFSGLGVPQPAHWLRVIGFRLHASSLESYLSKCKLFNFVDDDSSTQQVGQCYSFALTLESMFTVIYDTTGQFAFPQNAELACGNGP